jgi:hypothetical protein
MENIVKNNIGYSGKVKLTFLDGQHTIKTFEFKNSGTSTLFNFFAYCLMGSFDEAALYRPTKVRLLKVVKEALEDGYGNIESDTMAASGLIYLRSRPEQVVSNLDGQTVKLSFMIPRTMIEEVDFNRIALYPQFAGESDIYEYSAFCDLSGEDDLDINIYTAWTVSSVLLIDWELTISNKIVRVKDNENLGGDL